MRILWIGLFVVGCNGGGNKQNVMDDAPTTDPDAAVDAPPDAYEVIGSTAKSGTRLKVAWLTTPDGIKHNTNTSRTFYDSLFQKDCRSEAWTDGTTRCAPDAQVIVYADAQCTSKRAKSNDDGTLPAFHVERDLQGVTVQMFTAGTATDETSYWQQIGTSCVGPTPWFPGPGTAFPRTLNTLVSVTNVPILTSVRSGTGTLQRYWIISSDGLQVPSTQQAYDATLGIDCTVNVGMYRDPITADVCSPHVATTRYYQDTSCTIPVLVVPAGVTVPSFARPAGSRKLHSIGSTTSKPTRMFMDSCSGASLGSGSSYYLFGPEVGELQEVALVRESAPGHRLQPISFGSDIGFWTGWFHDTTLDLDCMLDRLGCRPLTARTLRLYTNAQCTTAVDVVDVWPDVAGQVTSPAFALDANNQVHRVGAKHVGALYNKLGTDCNPVYWETPMWTAFFDLDATVIPDSAFETAAYSIDP